jgi:streptogramin lyase
MALLASVLMLLFVSGCGGSGSTGVTIVAITISPNTPTLAVGSAPQQFNATGVYSNGISGDLTSSVTWSSSAPGVATITGAGLVTAVAAVGTTIQNGTIPAGKTTISAVYNGATASTVLTVIPAGVTFPITSWSTTGSPTGVAVASFSNYSRTVISGSNNVYVTDATYNLLRVYNTVGTQIMSWSTTGEPHGVAIDTNNNLYVIDISNNLLRIYNSTGTPSTTLPTLPTTGSPSGVAVDSAFNVYVTDSLNKQVTIYNSAGAQSKFVSTNWVPYGIAVDAHRNVYVTDITNSQVHIFDPNGIETPPPLSIAGYAYGVAVNPSGSNVFVSDYAGSLVLQYGPPGSPITLSSAPAYAPYGVALDNVGNVGNVYVTDLSNNLLHKYNQSQ